MKSVGLILGNAVIRRMEGKAEAYWTDEASNFDEMIAEFGRSAVTPGINEDFRNDVRWKRHVDTSARPATQTGYLYSPN